MRICYVLNSGNPGGMEQHVLDLAQGMHSKGHEVFIWMAGGEWVGKFQDVTDGVVVEEIKYDIDPIYIYKLSKYLKTNKIDVLHAHEIKAVSNALIAGFIAGVAVRISHTHTPLSEWQINPLKKRLNLLGNFFLVNFLSSKEIALTPSRKRIKMREGILGSKLEIIPNGINVEEFKVSDNVRSEYREFILEKFDIPDDAFVFGVVGRISEEKGHLLLLEAFYKSMNKMPDAYLIFAGGGPLEEEVRDRIDFLSIDDRVKISGRFPKKDHKKYFSTFDCFVHPTLAEGFGIVVLEALASNMNMLVSDLEVLKEVGGDHVNYFKTNDEKDLSAKLIEIYKKGRTTPADNTKLDYVENSYSMDKFIDLYENLYSNLLK